MSKKNMHYSKDFYLRKEQENETQIAKILHCLFSGDDAG
jgi:hypothetical protein